MAENCDFGIETCGPPEEPARIRFVTFVKDKEKPKEKITDKEILVKPSMIWKQVLCEAGQKLENFEQVLVDVIVKDDGGNDQIIQRWELGIVKKDDGSYLKIEALLPWMTI